MNKMKTSIVDMTSGSIAEKLALYAIPIILSDFLQQLYNSVDSIIVGNLCGKTALAAVGETFFITNMFLGLFLGISLGATVIISKLYGAKDYKGMAVASDTTLKLTAILCIVFTLAGVVLVPDLLKLVGTKEDVWKEAYDYLFIYLAGISAQLIYNMLSGMLKSIGDSKRPLYVLAFTAALNVGLDYLLVGPFQMGTAGAAYATVFAQALSCIVLWIIINKEPLFEKPLLRNKPMDMGVLKEIFRIGIPFSLQKSIISFSNTIVISYVNYFGSSVMAAYSIYQKIDQFVISSIVSIGSALTTFVAQNIGAGRKERIRKGVLIALGLSLVVSVAYAIFFIVFKKNIILLFNDDKEVVAFAETLFVTMISVHTINAFPQVFSGALRGMGESTSATLVMIFSYVFFRQAYLYIRFQTFKDVTLVMAGYHITWVICALGMFLLYLYKSKKILKETETVS